MMGRACFLKRYRSKLEDDGTVVSVYRREQLSCSGCRRRGQKLVQFMKRSTEKGDRQDCVPALDRTAMGSAPGTNDLAVLGY